MSVYDELATAEDLGALHEIEGLTNDRLRTELGQINLVPLEDRRVGPGWTPVMAAFCHPSTRPSRFSPGVEYGVYYAGLTEETAILESVHSRTRFLMDSIDHPPDVLEMRRYATRVVEPLDLLPTKARDRLLDPESHRASIEHGRKLRAAGSWGIYYPSVRDRPHGRCVAIFRPPALGPATQASHYRYYWDGSAVTRVERVGEAFNVLRA